MTIELEPFGSEARDGDLLISTVPAGAADFQAERGGFPRPVPPPCSTWSTTLAHPLAQAASRSGAVVVSGFDLLLHQAARQVELMTGIKPAPLAAMRQAGQAELARRAAC